MVSGPADATLRKAPELCMAFDQASQTSKPAAAPVRMRSTSKISNVGANALTKLNAAAPSAPPIRYARWVRRRRPAKKAASAKPAT